MARRYLFGPVTAAFSEQNLCRARRSGACRTFHFAAPADLIVEEDDSWDSVYARFPSHWRPDFLVFDLRRPIPQRLWSAPLPIVGLAADWQLRWHYYRRRLHRCGLILTDPAGVEALAQVGFTQAHAANLYGCERAVLEPPPTDGLRDIDVLAISDLKPALRHRVLPLLGRLARLADCRRVVIYSGDDLLERQRLMRRARIVIGLSEGGACGPQDFEAAACGTVLFQEASNPDIPRFFREGREYVAYTAENLEAKLEHYLEGEEELRAIARAGRARAQNYSFETLWEEHLSLIDREWLNIQQRANLPVAEDPAESLLTRTWQALSADSFRDASLIPDLKAALAADAHSARLHNALGLAVARAASQETQSAAAAEKAGEHFRLAWESDADNVLAGLNWAEALSACGRDAEAAEQAGQTLNALERAPVLDPRALDAGLFPLVLDCFRVEWEHAAWANAGRSEAEALAKAALLRWRLHALLAQLTGELAHFESAVQARPDTPSSQAELGEALRRAGRRPEAALCLHRALDVNPFDLDAARTLFHVLGETGDGDAQRRLAEERLRLARACPQAVLLEDWFAKNDDDPDGEERSFKARVVTPEEFRVRFGSVDTSQALHSFTPPADANIVLALLVHAQSRRILEIGTAAGHMTANLTEWSPDAAVVFTLGIVADAGKRGDGPQAHEAPDRANFGRFANHFNKANKVFFITADSLSYDFGRLGPLDFVFIDGAHDVRHVLSDSRNAYEQLSPGGWLVWHDYASPVPWVEVSAAIDQLEFAEPIFHVGGTGVAFLQKQVAADPPGNAEAAATVTGTSRQASGEKYGVVWEGSQFSTTSFARLNRELCRRLIERGHDVAVLIPKSEQLPASIRPEERVLLEYLRPKPNRPVDVHVRLQWPPDLTPPPEGRWVYILPWEFGSVPRLWADAAAGDVDEVWVPTQYVRQCYLDGGVPADRVYVVPCGVDVTSFHPEARPFPLRTSKRFKFLFVGGTVWRKGVDLLLRAYAEAFSARDDVCLVIKDLGGSSFYRGQTAKRLIEEHQARPDNPEVEHITRDLDADELAGVYTACDCLVHSYRGEGFGLPIAEAMASGLPIVVTGSGAALDFCDEANAYLIPSRQKPLPVKRIGPYETVDFPVLAEPDVEALRDYLRHIVAHPSEAVAKGRVGLARIRAEWTWDHAADVVERRLTELCSRPIRRTLHGAALPAAAQPSTPAASLQVAPVGERPSGAELASVVVHCRGGESTRLCLESVLRYTRRPYELILADEGGTSGAAAGLAFVRGRPGPERLAVIHNKITVGLAACFNQGLKEAKGRYVAFLTDDVVTTEDWLGRLVLCAMHQWPHVGVVGPVANIASGPQRVSTDYADLAGLPEFAARRRREYRGRARQVERLDGHCFLARREVLKQLGPWVASPQSGQDVAADLGRRARQAGFRLLAALDVFVYCFPNGSAANAARAKQRVSLCLIVRDEADKLAACLKSASDLVDEVVVVDTGSADATREAAVRCGARVVGFAWAEDFAAARNESVKLATGDWVFWMDADERLDEDARRKLRILFANLKDEKVAYVMRQLSETAEGLGSALAVDQVRLFRRDPGVRWEYRVHEQILLSLRRAGHEVRWTDVVIRHAGFQDAELSARKLERNMRLLRLQDAERPDDPVTLYHLGLALGQQERTEEALPLLRRSLERSPASYSIRPKLYAMLGRGLHRLGRRAEALAVCREGSREHPDYAELLYMEAILLREDGDPAGAEVRLIQLLGLPARPQFAALDAGLRSWKARHLLGGIYQELSRPADAETQWRAAVAAKPSFIPAWLSLGRLYLAQGRWRDLEQTATALEPLAPAAAVALRARAFLAQRNFEAAGALLQAQIGRFPQSVELKAVLDLALKKGRE